MFTNHILKNVSDEYELLLEYLSVLSAPKYFFGN